MASVILFLAEGFEEIEALAVVDLLRRAAIDVTTVALTENLDVRGGHDIVVKADTSLQHMPDTYDGIVLPGGGAGTKNLINCQKIIEIVKASFDAGLVCAAICAAPTVFGKAGILDNIRATCYPGNEDKLTGSKFIEAAVVRDKKVITSRGVATTLAFALELISVLIDEAAADVVKTQILYH